MDNWRYQRTFQVSSQEKSSQRIYLVCDGIDTISRIYINGFIPIAETNDQFMRYIFDVTAFIQVGTNTIQIELLSAVNYTAGLNSSYPYPLPITDLEQYQHGVKT